MKRIGWIFFAAALFAANLGVAEEHAARWTRRR